MTVVWGPKAGSRILRRRGGQTGSRHPQSVTAMEEGRSGLQLPVQKA